MTKPLFLLLLLALATGLGNSQSGNHVSLTPVPPAVQCKSPCQRHAVVFIHGFWGDETTWQNSESHRTWPQLMGQDPRFKDFDVFEAGYPTSAVPGAKGNNIRLTIIARDFNARLQQEIVPYYQTVSLIGHSMGGNIILTSILFLKFTNKDAHKILTKYKNIVLLGTPIGFGPKANCS